MPELKNTFTGGKMDKDTDERILPSGVYREAFNISVSTSEGSDVGAAQNILGNLKVTEAINGNTLYTECYDDEPAIFKKAEALQTDGRYEGTNNHIASVVDPESDMLYRFISTVPNATINSVNQDHLRGSSEFQNNHGVWMDRIVEYDTTKMISLPWYKKEKAVMVDIYRVETTLLTIENQGASGDDDEVATCNKSVVTICANRYQVRPGMVLSPLVPPRNDNEATIYIESITYSSGKATILLNKDIDGMWDDGEKVAFKSDRVLSFSSERAITGINIIGGMIFWTDNHSEPKKVNIKRGKLGSTSTLYGSGYSFDSNGTPITNPKSYGCNGNAADACYSDFDQHTKLMVEGQVAIQCDKISEDCNQTGCMDPTATNWNPSANSPCDECCEYAVIVYGCTDQSACNYDDTATVNDGSCVYAVGNCQECNDDGEVDDIVNAMGVDGYNFCAGSYTCVKAGFDNDSCADEGTVNIQNPQLVGGTSASTYAWNSSQAWASYYWPWHGYPLDVSTTSTTPISGYHHWIHQYSDNHIGASCEAFDGAPTGTYNGATGYSASYNPNDPNKLQSCIDTSPNVGSNRFKSRISRVELLEVNITERPDDTWASNGDKYWNRHGTGDAVDFTDSQVIMSWDTTGADTTTVVDIVSFIKTEFGLNGLMNATYNNTGVEIFVPSGGASTTTVADNTAAADFDIFQNKLLNGVTGSVYVNGTSYNSVTTNGLGTSSPIANTSTSGALKMFLNIISEPCTCTDDTPVLCYDTYDNTGDYPATWAESFIEYAYCEPDVDGRFKDGTPEENLQECMDDTCVVDSPLQFNSNFNELKSITLPSPLKMGKNTEGPPPNHNPQVLVNAMRGLPIIWDTTEQTCTPVYVQEKHLTVVRKSPTSPPKIQMYNWADGADLDSDGKIILETTFGGGDMPNKFNWDQACEFDPTLNNTSFPNVPVPSIEYRGKGTDKSSVSIFYDETKSLKQAGDTLILPIDILNASGGQGQIDWADTAGGTVSGDRLIVYYDFTDTNGNTITATCRLEVLNSSYTFDVGAAGYLTAGSVALGSYFTNVGPYSTPGGIECLITQTSSDFPVLAKHSQVYRVRKEQKPPLFENKFPRFSYRYKYEDGEYSSFAPWSEIAFLPGKFDYLPKKGYNLGMVNHMRSLNILDWNPKGRPRDVVEIDLLYKESSSPNVYTVKSFKNSDTPDAASGLNPWNSYGTGANQGRIGIQSELIHKTVPSNQMLRPWDNVPRYALAQDMTANRLVYANYLQNYNMVDIRGRVTKPKFSTIVKTNILDFDDMDVREPIKSLKSMRNYQIGVVYRDRYGRETPVMTDPSGSVDIDKKDAKYRNRLEVQMISEPPAWAESYTFYVKETSNEYYNLAMDRWYNADDDGIWLSFPSSERNKVTERTMLLMKKQHDSDIPIDSEVKYKILDIKNDAPIFIKTEHKFWGALPMMLPPPGWGVSGKVGNWDTGMFNSTGLPLPNRLYLDVYAEYFDQSILSGLMDQSRAQIRVVQSEGQASSYNAGASASVNKSDWYDVSNISYIGSPAETTEEETTAPDGTKITKEVEIPGQGEQIVRITLEQMMGEDMSFCNPMAGDNLSLARGIALEARTSVVRDRSQFQGRFFVKILRDAEVQTNIVLSGKSAGDTWQVLYNQDVKYVSLGHPGVQDYMTGKSGTVGGGKGKWYGNRDEGNGTSSYNYLPIGKRWLDTAAGVQTQKYEVSSFHPMAGDASYRNASNALKNPPTGSNKWPMGPGKGANPAFMAGWWYNRFYDKLKRNRATAYYNEWKITEAGDPATYPGVTLAAADTIASIWPDTSSTYNYWPSYEISEWEPYAMIQDSPNYSATYPYPNGKFDVGVDLTSCLDSYPGLLTEWEGGASGANPFLVSAILGDQSDLLGYTGNGASPTAITPLNTTYSGSPRTFPSEWNSTTIEKLRQGWYHMWHGRDKFDSDWPLGRFEPERWFIDKAGAAQGYSGAGIWDFQIGSVYVSRMDLSFYGIGSVNTYQRTHDMNIENENAVGFAELIATVGTQFRFKQDPNQTVYTVQEAKMSGADYQDVFNYEASHGSWGLRDANGFPGSGGGLGSKTYPPWGSSRISSGSVASKAAFYSDFFNSRRELNGGSPYNYRQRITITLDKQIGSEGAKFGSADMGFHPLKNHVDEDGNCNIKGGAKRYSSLGPASNGWKAPAGTFPEAIGGIPNTKSYFNLSSYWNKTGGADNNGQSELRDDVAYGQGQYFGLHERGLNETTIEIITPYKGDEPDKTMSNNPAIFETEPMEDVGLDLYYAASPAYPIELEKIRSDLFRPDFFDVDHFGYATEAHFPDYNWRGEEVIPVGCTVELVSSTSGSVGVYPGPRVVGVQGGMIWTDGPVVTGVNSNNIVNGLDPSDIIAFKWNGEGYFYGGKIDDQFFQAEVKSVTYFNVFGISTNIHNNRRSLGYFNCYTFSNGVESNRFRDDYNAVTIDKGVKASMPLAEGYEEERKGSSLIFSGIYNSTSGVNRTNQFIQAEPITKDLNPVNGSIQKLFARDTDLVTFCENKVFKILAKKDALFNADGNSAVTSNKAVLGQAIPFSGEFGISKNPESFASQSYRLYFADKARGAVLRLSRDGITSISEKGMKDWFKDNLFNSNKIVGSYDDRKEHYNITISTWDFSEYTEKAITLSYMEDKRGWESFKGFLQSDGISHKNNYYTFPDNKWSRSGGVDPWGVPYSILRESGLGIEGIGEMWQHHVDMIQKRLVEVGSGCDGCNTISVNLNNTGIINVGFNVEGNGIPVDTTVIDIDVSAGVAEVELSNSVFVEDNQELTFSESRNNFYGRQYYSSLKTVFNKDQGSVKRFKTINYEGTQGKVVPEGGSQITNNFHTLHDVYGAPTSTNHIIRDNWEKEGWYVDNLLTDLQTGSIKEFVDKENKWFDYIRGKEDAGIGDDLDTAEFSLQGLGTALNAEFIDTL